MFDDPGDDKSWCATQRSESLERFYEGREPSWYASAVAPLRGARRVLDIGCGPGLALAQLREEGTEVALGVDRWPGFVPRTEAAGVRMVLHDLTLPMPFIDSGSYDGILSHYALNYMSPIGVRQVLRECARILADDGLLLLYLGAIGLASGDDSQTVPYQGPTMEALLEEAGFTDIQVEMSPNGRNTVARARPAAERSGLGAVAAAVTGTGVRAEFDGETQLIAAFDEAEGGPIGVSLFDDDHSISFQVECGSGGERMAVCARVIDSQGPGTDLHLWAWDGMRPVAAEALRMGFRPRSIQLNCEGHVEYVDAWSPQPVPIERRGSAYAPLEELAPGEGLSEAERGAEGRLVVVESEHHDREAAQRAIGPGRNRFLVRRPGSDPDTIALDGDFAAGRLAGVAIDRATATGGGMPELSLWAARRQALVVVEGGDWDEIAATIESAESFLGSAPLLIADPALTGGEASPPTGRVLSLAAARESRFLVLPAGPTAPAGLGGRVLRGGLPPVEDPEAAEALRHLTERTLLMSMRLRADRPGEQLGRGPAL